MADRSHNFWRSSFWKFFCLTAILSLGVHVTGSFGNRGGSPAQRRFLPDFQLAQMLPSPVLPAPASATYRLTFESTWSAATHPTDFPVDAHFSRLVGATHTQTANLWQLGELASPGIQSMAETGSPTPLREEVEGLKISGRACEFLLAERSIASPGVAELTFTATQACPLVSVVTMIAPSPDWFVGVSGVALYEDQVWVDTLTIPLLPYDGGTDGGTTYDAANLPERVPEPIAELHTEPFVVNGEIPSLGSFTFTRL